MSNDEKLVTRNSRFVIFDPYFWLTLLLSLPVVGPLLQPGYQWGAHDARHAVYFLFQFDKSIQDGVWYPRWSPDFAFGYGYPFFNVYSPLSSYAGELFLWLGFDFVDAVKIVLGLSAVLSGLTMFLFARKMLGSAAGLIAGISYVYIPYHLFDLYVRSALAESMGFVFVPLVLWGFVAVVTAPNTRNIIGAAMAYAALMFTHNSTALMLTPFLGLYVLTMMLFAKPYSGTMPRKILAFIQRGIPAALALGWGIGLSAIFLFPAILETKFVRVDQWVGGRYAFGSDFVDIFQLFSPRWGFGASIPGPNDEAGFQIGLAALVLFTLSFWAIPRLENRAHRLTLYFFQAMAIIVAFLTTPLSIWLWQALPLVSFAQFPWRLLVIVTPAMALVAGSVATLAPTENKRQRMATIVPLALLILLSSFPYVKAELRDPKPTEGPVDLAGLFRFQQASDEMTGSTAWVKEIPAWSTLADLVIAGGDITTRVVQTEIWNADGAEPLLAVNSWGDVDSVHEMVWVYAADDQQVVTFFIPYYPGWTATVYADTDPENSALYPYGRIGEIVAQPDITTTEPEGWIEVAVPAGYHFVELRFEDTPIRVVGKYVSLISLILATLSFIFHKKTDRLLAKVL